MSIMRCKFFIFLVSASILLFSAPLFAEGFWERLFKNKEEFVALITIENKCDLETRYFIVRNLDTGKYAPFNNGLAKLKAVRNAPLQLQLTPSVKYISYEGVAVAAKKKLTMTADCSERSLKMIGQD